MTSEILPHGVGDLYHRFRPRVFDEVVGQDAIIKSIRAIPNLKDSSRTLLFYGDSGTGKTTTARILAAALNCEHLDGDNPCRSCISCVSIQEGTSPDFLEINASDTRGIDDIRAIKDSMTLMPMFLRNKIIILDECHSLTTPAQQSLLKVLEEAPKNVYLILASTDPKKLLPTVLNRCQKFQFKRVSEKDIKKLIDNVCGMCGVECNAVVASRIVDKAGGSPRNALVLLQQLEQAGLLGKEGQEVDDILVSVSDEDAGVIELCRALSKKGTWQDIVTLYNGLSIAPEGVRLTVLGYFRSVLLRSGAHNASKIMDIFTTPFYDTKPENNLVLCLYKAWRVYNGP